MHPKVQGSMIHAANGRDASAQPRGDTSQMVVEPLLPEIPACQNKGHRTQRSRQNTAERAKHGTAGTTLQRPTAVAVPCVGGAIGGEGGIHAVPTAATVAAGMGLQSGVAHSLQHKKTAPDNASRQMRAHLGGRRDEQSEKLLEGHAQAWCADRVASAGVATTAPRQWGICHESSADCVLSDVAQRPQQCIQAAASSEGEADAVQLSPSPARSGRPQRRASQGVARLLKALQQPVGPVVAATPFRKRKRSASQTGRARLQQGEAASSQETVATIELHLQGRTQFGCHQAEDREEPCEPPARKPRLGVSLSVWNSCNLKHCAPRKFPAPAAAPLFFDCIANPLVHMDCLRQSHITCYREGEEVQQQSGGIDGTGHTAHRTWLAQSGLHLSRWLCVPHDFPQLGMST